MKKYGTNLDDLAHLSKKKNKSRVYYKLPIILRPLLLFLYSYFFRLGFLNGWQGFVFHFLRGFWYRLLVDLKILEFKKLMKNKHLTLEQVVKSKYTDNI